MDVNETGQDVVPNNPAQQAQATAPDTVPATTTAPSAVADKGVGSGKAEKRIRQLVAGKKELEGKLAAKEAELERLARIGEEPPANAEPAKQGLEAKLAKLERELYELKADKAVDEQVAEFKGNHPDLSDEEVGIVTAIADSYGLKDNATNTIDFDSAHEIYSKQIQRILEKKGIKTDAPKSPDAKPTNDVLGGAPRGGSGQVTKKSTEMTEDELRAEFYKILPR